LDLSDVFIPQHFVEETSRTRDMPLQAARGGTVLQRVPSPMDTIFF